MKTFFVFSPWRELFHNITNSIQSMKALFGFVMGAAIIMNGCNLNKVNGTTDNPHETKIFVQLSGKYAWNEAADVTIGTGGTTVADKNNKAYAAVDPGTYTITAIAHVIPGTWTHTTTIKQGEQKTIDLVCDDATVAVQPDALWIGTHNNFKVDIYSDDPTVLSFTVLPGSSNSIAVHPGKGVHIYVTDANTGAFLTQTYVDLFYKGTFTLTIPYK
jgi:hypothetical protein